MKQRPAWISIISVWLMVSGALWIAGLLYVSVRYPSSWLEPSEMPIGIAELVLACVTGMIGWGLWKLRRWARTSLIIMAWLGSITEVGRRIVGGHPAVSEIVFQVAFLALLLWYLARPGVRDAFTGEDHWSKVVHWAVLAVFVVLLAFPFYWMVIAAFKPNADLYNVENNPFLFNVKPTLDQLRLLFGDNDYHLTTFFAIQVVVAALLVWLWRSRNKGRVYLFGQLALTVLSAFVHLRLANYRLSVSLPVVFLFLYCYLAVLLVAYLLKPDEGGRIAVVLLLVIDLLGSSAALFWNVLHQSGFVRWLGNTAFVGVLVVAITLLLSIPAAYALARLTGRWGEQLGIGIFLTYLVPPTLLFIPLSRVIADLGLQDSIWSLVLVYPSVTIPFSTWLLMGFFKSIPRELEDAAMVDGLTRFGAFVRMVIPISISGILTVVIFTFTLVTQEFVYALTFISPESNQMVGVGIPIFLVRGDVYFWGSLMAACLIASLPIAFLYNLFLDRFIAGFTVGAVKG